MKPITAIQSFLIATAACLYTGCGKQQREQFYPVHSKRSVTLIDQKWVEVRDTQNGKPTRLPCTHEDNIVTIIHRTDEGTATIKFAKTDHGLVYVSTDFSEGDFDGVDIRSEYYTAEALAPLYERETNNQLLAKELFNSFVEMAGKEPTAPEKPLTRSLIVWVDPYGENWRTEWFGTDILSWESNEDPLKLPPKIEDADIVALVTKKTKKNSGSYTDRSPGIEVNATLSLYAREGGTFIQAKAIIAHPPNFKTTSGPVEGNPDIGIRRYLRQVTGMPPTN